MPTDEGARVGVSGVESPGHQGSVRRSMFAVGALFFVNGAGASNWLPRIPEVRDRLGLSNAGLGTSLIGVGLGGVIGSLLVARVLGRFGTRRVLIASSVALVSGLPLIAVVPSALALAAVLLALGLFDVFTDMAMNAQAATVQEQIGRSIVQRLHGMWSLGFMIGAAAGSLAAAVDLRIGVHLVLVSVVMLSALAAAAPSLLRVDPQPVVPDVQVAGQGGSGPATWRSRAMVAMMIAAAAVAWLESTPSEWSAVAMRDVFDADRSAGTATLVFAAAMLIGRLLGDHAVDRWGSSQLLDRALVLAGVGAFGVIVAPVGPVALVGFALWGLGVSVLFPQLYAMAARADSRSAGAGLGALGIGQRLGFLAGPLVVGNLADGTSLRTAFAFVVALAAGLVVVSRRMAATPAGT